MDGTPAPEPNVERPTPTRIAVASGVALVVAMLVLVGGILPAEYGIDPLGIGRALGLLTLAQVRPIETEESVYRQDAATLEVSPGEWVEYTYRFEEGGTMVFSWDATGDVSYNFHSAPDGAPPGYAESFDARESSEGHGAYTAPFSGIHGWYWENLGADEVTIRLTTAGFYRSAHEARDRVDGTRALRDAWGDPVPAPGPGDP